MANETKTTEFEEVDVVAEEADDENVTETRTSKVKAWFSRHKVGLTRLAKGAALVGGGLVAGILIAHKKADDEEALELESGDWCDYDDDEGSYKLPEAETVEDAPEEEKENEEA